MAEMMYRDALRRALDEEMRRDVIDLIRRSVNAGRGVFLLVNNKAEGSSPLTVEALAERLVAERSAF